jgi:hypothetical protein
MIGDLIDTVPSLEKIEKGQVTDKLKVMFASTHTLEELNRFSERQLKKLYQVQEYDNLAVE